MNSHLLEKAVLLALVLGAVLFVVSKLAPQIQEFTEKTGKRIENTGSQMLAVRRDK